VIAVVPFFGRLVIEYGMRERVFKSLLGRVMTRADAATLDAYWEPYRDPRMRRALAATFSGYPRSAAAVRRVRHGLGDLSMPVEILFGAEDPHCPPPNARAFAAAMPNANATVLAGVGHFVPEEEPARVAGAIRRAIERHETASAVARQSALAGRDA
jgi:pimeloyl-ACP methyl ester carboxylesterase